MEELPIPSNSPAGKCIALVERISGDKDYVIFANGGIVADKQPMSAVRKIIEYYPAVKAKKVVEQEPEPVIEKTPEPVASTEYNRNEAIKFLVSKKMNEGKMKEKNDDELKKLLKVFRK
jgi:hypothetical protein